MRDPWNDSRLVEMFRATAKSSLPRAPLNAALCDIIGRDRTLSSMLAHAPLTQQQPVLMLAVIHHLVLNEPEHDLARWYPNLTDDHVSAHDPRLAIVLKEFVVERAPSVFELLASRRTQTNEVGRCGVFLPLFEMIASDVDEPLAHIDVGTSGGLNLLLPHFAYQYDDHSQIGSSPVELEISTRGSGPVPSAVPTIAASCGIDSAPLDVTDTADARWLEACCWPDQADRFHRLRRAIEVARGHGSEIVASDAVAAVGPVIERLAERGHPVVTTSWVLNYLTPPDRSAFVAALDDVARAHDLSWVSAESAALTPEIPHSGRHTGEHTTELSLITWRNGERTDRHLGRCHPHGYWIHWDE